MNLFPPSFRGMPSRRGGGASSRLVLADSIGELNARTGWANWEYGWNFSAGSASLIPPISGSLGPSLAPFTGSMAGFGNGTAPTLVAAPQVSAGLAQQEAVEIDSDGDNLWGVGAMPDVAFTGIVVLRSPNGTHPGGGRDILGIQSNTAGQRPWSLRSTAGGTLQIESYDSYSGTVRSASVTSGSIANDGLWHVVVFRRANAGGTNRIKVDALSAASSAATTQSPSALSQEGGLGRIYQNPFGTHPLNGTRLALWAWSTVLATDGEIDTISSTFKAFHGI